MGKMKESVGFISDFYGLFYLLKQILKYNFDDLSYEVFKEIVDPKYCPEP